MKHQLHLTKILENMLCKVVFQ
jgi:hypothetical protein